MADKTLQEPLTDKVREKLERIIREDLENATIVSAGVEIDTYNDPAGAIVIRWLEMRLPDGRGIDLAIGGSDTGADVEIVVCVCKDGEVQDMTVAEDYAEELADATAVWHPEPDTLEEARL